MIFFQLNKQWIHTLQHVQIKPATGKKSNYALIAEHYKWALDKAFSWGYDTVIVTEGDCLRLK